MTIAEYLSACGLNTKAPQAKYLIEVIDTKIKNPDLGYKAIYQLISDKYGIKHSTFFNMLVVYVRQLSRHKHRAGSYPIKLRYFIDRCVQFLASGGDYSDMPIRY